MNAKLAWGGETPFLQQRKKKNVIALLKCSLTFIGSFDNRFIASSTALFTASFIAFTCDFALAIVFNATNSKLAIPMYDF
jgi:hypothetical protein